MVPPPPAVFNPKILDASIRDVSSYLSDNQKVDLLLYAMKSLRVEGRSRQVIENAIQSCLQVTTLSQENVAKARILRARARLAGGAYLGGQEDLQAALAAEPDNPEAKALLHQRSVTVEKLLSPLPLTSSPSSARHRLSTEIWQEIALYLSGPDLKSLLLVPHALSRIASQLLFRKIDLYFTNELEGAAELGDDGSGPDEEERREYGYGAQDLEEDGVVVVSGYAQRSADILTRIITDTSFACGVKYLRIFADTGGRRRRGRAMAFQTGMLNNALPKLINLRSVHLSATSDGIGAVLRTLQVTCPRLKGLSIKSSDAPIDLSFLEFKHLTNFSYVMTSPSTAAPTKVFALLSQNKATLRTLSLESQSIHPSPHWTFPTGTASSMSAVLSIRNLTTINFTGQFPAITQAFTEILTHGRQLENLSLQCCALETSDASSQFRSVLAQNAAAGNMNTSILPFLRHFSLVVLSVGRRTLDRDLFPAIAEFLRGRRSMRTLQLVAQDEVAQHATGFDASIWGVLPSLDGLKGLWMTYPPDLSPGLASWLIPRGLKALRLDLGREGGGETFLNQLRPGIPSSLRFIGLSDSINIRGITDIVEHGFPMVKVVRVGANYWTVVRRGSSDSLGRFPMPSLSRSNSMIMSHPHTHGAHASASSRSHSNSPPMSMPMAGHAQRPQPRGPSRSSRPSHLDVVVGPSTSSSSSGSAMPSSSIRPPSLPVNIVPSGLGNIGNGFELEQWPRRRALYHAPEWLEWFGCEDAMVRDVFGCL
ncbi:hypothetical protein D9613_003616 [Agrocybe pediades]|uniref:Uncharacterized protein n=1 Tax=Agrocybe pediades TaxID=84607 RepID=A0A8H4VLB8_9AGAR|nr:hypothetical protein D9613_003616 [Agrocybe pediades]